MPKIHVVDNFLNETLEYKSEKEIEFHRVVEYIRTGYDEETNPNAALKAFKLDNGVIIKYYENGFDVFTDENRIVYSPVYDVETCEREGYSMYEEEDILGYVNRGYDYANYLD